MTDSVDSYTYSKGDLFERPNSYMYTPYHGVSFLHAYRQDREEALRHLIKSANNWPDRELKAVGRLLQSSYPLPLYPELGEIFEVEHASTQNEYWEGDLAHLQVRLDAESILLRTVLDLMLAVRERGLHRESLVYHNVLAKLRRKFEVKKLLFDEYEQGFGKGIGEVRNFGNYARLSLLFSLELNSDKCLQTTNVLLKINDVLSFVKQELSSSLDQILAALSLARELAHISALMQLQEVG